jgi:nitrite reductase/ring-hydroxylating ferredoxin subunit
MIRLCAPSELAEGQSLGFLIGQMSLFAVRRGGQVYAYLNRCPHRGITLEWQKDRFLDDSGSLIRCSTHGALFLIESGECVAGPCEGQSLQALECREDAHGVWIEGAAAR